MEFRSQGTQTGLLRNGVEHAHTMDPDEKVEQLRKETTGVDIRRPYTVGDCDAHGLNGIVTFSPYWENSD
jgi:hypothetical protein